MSKRVPVYLDEEELRILAYSLYELKLQKGCVTKKGLDLEERINEELERNFEEG